VRLNSQFAWGSCILGVTHGRDARATKKCRHQVTTLTRSGAKAIVVQGQAVCMAEFTIVLIKESREASKIPPQQIKR